MCLAIPGRIIETWSEGAAPFAHADFDGDVRRISIAFLPDLQVGEYTIVHAGFALSRVPEEQVALVMESMRDAGLIDDDRTDDDRTDAAAGRGADPGLVEPAGVTA